MSSTPKRSTILKIILIVLVIAAVAVLFHFLPLAAWLTTFKAYVKSLGALGYLLYALVYALCVILFIPASILTLGAGAIFGLAGGTIVVVIGATLGATGAFLLARTVLRHKVESMTAGNAKFRALDRAIAKEGAKIVLLVRLAVVFPFTYSNYAFGLTGIRTLPYFLATFFGIIPATFAFVYIGAAAETAATSSASKVKLAVYIGGAILALIASLFVGRVAAKAIRKAGVDE
jgi:uncharacterized membrane protein YdjX (TVP38/TMEM64 family)